ncbi:MAG: hypothetical protein IJI06_06710 [Oscillospiraceae bacterium]|nr:hypothetical protein [Oscillospiraceae bacterium]
MSDKNRMLRAAVLWAAVGVLTALFAVGYERLSYGVVSSFMVCAFLIPLVLGSGVNILLLALHAHAAGELCAAFWKLAVGVLTVGCLLQGALEIYGTANRLMIAYPVSGAILISLAALCYLMRK